MSESVRIEQVREILKRVLHPDAGRDIVTLGLVKDAQVSGSTVTVTLELPAGAPGVREKIEPLLRQAVASLPGVTDVQIKATVKLGVTQAPPQDGLQGIKNIVAVASGKGGVGKSTVAANLAMALQLEGARTGLMDADIYGPSVPIMMGTRDRPPGQQGNQILPVLAHGMKMMSIGFVAPANAPVIWRGPMVHKIVNDFLRSVAWGELDYLVIDLPPGTGDAQLTLTQTAPLSGAVIVTTPQDVALEDVNRAVRMFEEVKVPVLGVIENMSYHTCAKCGHREDIFSHGGGKEAAKRFKVEFLGEIPLLGEIRAAGDRGLPIVAAEPDSQTAQSFRGIARAVMAQLAVSATQKPTLKF